MGDNVRAVLIKGSADLFSIRDIAFDQRPPFHGLAPATGEVVEYDDRPAGAREGLAAMRTDIAGTAGNENRLHSAARGLPDPEARSSSK
jgi:hypothetical protein